MRINAFVLTCCSVIKYFLTVLLIYSGVEVYLTVVFMGHQYGLRYMCLLIQFSFYFKRFWISEYFMETEKHIKIFHISFLIAYALRKQMHMDNVKILIARNIPSEIHKYTTWQNTWAGLKLSGWFSLWISKTHPCCGCVCTKIL